MKNNITFSQISSRVKVKNASVSTIASRQSLPKASPTGTSTYAPPTVTPVSNQIPKKPGIPSSKG